MKKFEKVLAVLLVLILGSSFVFANGTEEQVQAQEGPTEVLLWNAVTGTIANWIQECADEFNASQDEYVVNIEYQGSYMEVYNKLTTTLDQADLPDMAIVSTELVGTYLLTEGLCEPLSTYWASDDSVWANLNGSLKAIWGNNSEPGCFPLGNSFYGNFVNADIFEAAGIDPYEALTSVKGLYETCKALVEGGYCEYGAGLDSWGGFVWYGLAAAGVPFMDNDNGHSGIPEKILIDTPEVTSALYDYFYYFRKMQEEGLIVPYGSSWGDEVLPAFASKRCAIATGSIAAFGRVETAMAADPFNLAWVPCWSAVDLGHAPEGYAASGTGFCVINSGDEKAMQGAADFIAFTGKAQNQVKLDLAVGYLPISQEVVDDPQYQDFIANRFPAAAKAFELQKNGVVDAKHTNPLNPINNACQTASANAWSQVMSDFSVDIYDVIANMQKSLQNELDMWRITNL